MYRRLLSHSLGLGLLLSAGACAAPDVGQPCPIPPDAVPGDAAYTAALNKCFPAMSEQAVDTRIKKDVDILFVIDNSTSMSPKQAQLATAIGNFITQIDATGANYHVGVVTTDVGTLPPPGNMFPQQSDARCGTLNGDDGKLQNTRCTQRTANVSPEFTTACNKLCPSSVVTPQQRWIGKDDGVVNVPDPIAAFKCIGLVGDSGCGVESPLEAAKRALDKHNAENDGFLRDNSVLTIIYITDEDDCSVQIAQRNNLNPAATPDCGQSNPDPAYGCYNLDFRCIAKDLVCNEPLDKVGGPKTGCKERDNSFLEPVEKYSRFISALRPAEKLVLGGIWSPSILNYNNNDQTPGRFGDGRFVVGLDTGTTVTTSNLNRGKKTDAACYNPDPTLTTDVDKGYFGQAQLRLELFKNKFDPSIWSEQSICDALNYGNILNNIAKKITNAVGADCLGVDPNVDSNGNPACLVGYVDASQDSSLPDTYLPVCGRGCCDAWANSAQPVGPYGTGTPPSITKDPAIVSACTAEAADCYCALDSKKGLCPGVGIAGVWTKGNGSPPSGKVVNFRCAGTRPANPPTM